MMVCDSGTRSNKVTSDSFYWGTCHWKMPFLAPEMQQVLAGILAAILWTYFQGGRMCFKKMKSDEIEPLRSDCIGFGLCVHPCVNSSKTVHARVLKFHIWISHGKISDTRFYFLVRVISLSGVMPL